MRRRDLLALLGGEHAKNVFGSEQIVAAVVRSAMFRQAHRSRHSLSFIRLRRSQVRIVFSGTPWRAASSA